jgi:uncharacterized protein YegP (UPF0339 family)
MPVVEAALEPLTPTEVMTEQMPVAAKLSGVFEVFYDSLSIFRFHLKAANGEIIAASQFYLSRQSVENGIASVKENAPMAKIIDQTTAVT